MVGWQLLLLDGLLLLLMNGCIATWSIAAADGRNTDRLVAADIEGWVVDGVAAVAAVWFTVTAAEGWIAAQSTVAAGGWIADHIVAAECEGWVADGVTAVATGWLAGGPVAAMAYSTTINETTQDPGICWDEYLFYQPRVIMYMHLLLYYSLFLLLYYSLLCVSRRSDHGNEGSYQNTA